MGTELCIFLLKDTIHRFTSRGTPVYVAFLDASKAFDRVNYYKCFSKLVDAGVNALIVRLILFWYRSQTIFVSWNGCISRGFHATNGVRQGSVLSPLLFNICMADLSKELNCSPYGCRDDTGFINHIFYADDIFLMCTSVHGLRRQLLWPLRYYV